MDDPRLPRTLYFFLVLICLLMAGYYYPQMPQRMAALFAADGSPNGYQPRESFFLLTAVICACSAVVTFFAPWQIAAKADARINLPNKEYWLAPERRESTLTYIASTMSWFGCGLLFVLISGTFLAVRANLTPEHHFNASAMWVVLVSFLVFLLLLTGRLVRHFQSVSQS